MQQCDAGLELLRQRAHSRSGAEAAIRKIDGKENVLTVQHTSSLVTNAFSTSLHNGCRRDLFALAQTVLPCRVDNAGYFHGMERLHQHVVPAPHKYFRPKPVIAQPGDENKRCGAW